MGRGSVTRGERNCAWIERYCRVPEGKSVGEQVKLRPFQRSIVCGIYDTPTRRAVISFGRKNGKTGLSAFLLLLHLCGPEARANSQLYSAAQSRDQAALLFNLAAKVVRFSPDLRAVVAIRDTAKQLACAELGTLYRALSAEASTAYGLSPVFTVHDELGQVRGPRSELYEALETAAGAQESPLSIVISTQAPNDGDLLSLLIDDAGSGHDARTKLFLYSAPVDADPFAEETIRAANPAFGDFLNPVEVREQAEAARRMPSRESAYRNLILNQRISADDRLIAAADWKGAQADFDADDLIGRRCYAGLDLSSTQDLTSLVLAFPPDGDGPWFTLSWFWLPGDGIAEKAIHDRVPYDLWAKQGHLSLTDGRAVDKLSVVRLLAGIMGRFDVVSVAYDRWRIEDLKMVLQAEGIDLPLAPYGQGYKDMAPAVDELERLILNGKLRHNGNPVQTWCASNAVVQTDPAGNRKITKEKATGRVDGIVALCMALGVSLSTPVNERSFWETVN